MTQEPQFNKLCQKCQDFTLYSLLLPEPRSWCHKFAFHDINGLLQSAKEGCHVCNLIVAVLPEIQILILQRELELDPQHCSQQLEVAIYDFYYEVDRDVEIRLEKFSRYNSDLLVRFVIHDMGGK